MGFTGTVSFLTSLDSVSGFGEIGLSGILTGASSLVSFLASLVDISGLEGSGLIGVELESSASDFWRVSGVLRSLGFVVGMIGVIEGV